MGVCVTFLSESSWFFQLNNLDAVNNRYLTVQFVRFFWKRETNQKAKILRVLFLVLSCSRKFVLSFPDDKVIVERSKTAKYYGYRPKSS